jgi:hypothetical protein
MDITTFLASLWGPVILAVGVGVFVSRGYYIKIYRDLEQAPLAVLLFGMVAMTAGIAHVLAHNIWDTFPQILVSFLGWAVLIKGALFIIAPKFVDKAGDGWANMQLIPFAGGLMLLFGAYLTYFAYFA